jgi:hypothetical protein
MKICVGKTGELGELVVAAFNAAAHYSRASRHVSRLATAALIDVLYRARGASTPQSSPRSTQARNHDDDVLDVWEGEGGSGPAPAREATDTNLDFPPMFET